MCEAYKHKYTARTKGKVCKCYQAEIFKWLSMFPSQISVLRNRYLSERSNSKFLCPKKLIKSALK
jgi:hypothetical protein